jgi:hypothetical protein
MASPFKDRKLMFLTAAAMTIIAAGMLIANVQDANGKGVRLSNDTLDQLTSVVVQVMVVSWIALFGYFTYRYLKTRKRYRAKGERRSGEGQNILPYAFVLLALWLILFVGNPLGGNGLFRPPETVDSNSQTNSTFPSEQTAQDLPLVFPLIVVVVAVASILFVWKALRRGRGPKVDPVGRSADEEAKATLDEAVKDLYGGQDPHSTIIRTYQRMCLLVQPGKLDEEPYLTPREFAELAVQKLGWERGPLVDLTGLFEEARYSDHVLGETEKSRAVALFERVNQGLGGAPDAGTAQ